jgi:hypothetical protein
VEGGDDAGGGGSAEGGEVTVDGWALLGADGKAAAFVANPAEVRSGRWVDPRVEAGQVTVYLQNGAGGRRQALDEASGKLVARDK